jgi:hypothetical protein
MANALSYSKEVIAPNTTVFMFDKIYDYNDFIEQKTIELPQLNTNAKRVFDNSVSDATVEATARDITKYGTRDVNLVKGKLDTFIDSNRLNSFLEQFRDQTVSFDAIDIDQKKKIVFTSQEIGIFSFDLASLGLIRVYEYFSPYLNRIISGNFVKSYKNDEGQLVFYHIMVEGYPRHALQLKKGVLHSTRLDREVSFQEADKVETEDKIEYYMPEKLKVQKHEVERRQKIDKKGNKVFSSTFKKSFIYIPKVTSQLPRIDLIINASYSYSVDALDQMIWSSMAAISIAEKLSASNVDFRIYASYPVRFNNNKKTYTFVKIKDSSEPLNINGLAIMTSDGRQFRYQQFKGYILTGADAGYGSDIGGGIGTPINNETDIKNAFIEYLKKTKNFDSSDAAVFEDSKIVFGQSLTRQSAIDKYNSVVQQISNVTTP